MYPGSDSSTLSDLNLSPPLSVMFGGSIHIGTAGWNVPGTQAASFPREGSHLERYARVFGGVEINSSFYRPHRLTTYQRWAAAVPAGFRFAVKIPKAITHDARLTGATHLLDQFLSQVAGLGEKLGPLLVQLPPSLSFKPGVSDAFLEDLRSRVGGPIACEPRHATWFTPDVDLCLEQLRVARVAADPEPVPGSGRAGGWRGLSYHRLHGSPTIYVSPYNDNAVRAVTTQLAAEATQGRQSWCIFDNTAAGAAVPNALTAVAMIKEQHHSSGD